VIDEVVAATMAAPPRLGGVRLVAIDGPSGAGKSTFAAKIADGLDNARLISTDDFATWANPVAWWPRLDHGVLRPLAGGRPGRYQRTEWPDGCPRLGEWITVDVPGVLVLEGVSAGRQAAQGRLSCLVWVDFADAPARLARSVARDGEASRAYLRRWQEFEAGWFAVDRPAARAGHKIYAQ
jgi:hypothetical protein